MGWYDWLGTGSDQLDTGSDEVIDDTIESSTGGDSGVDMPTWTDLAPNWLQDNENFLRTFANNPRATIFGVIASVVVGGILDLWVAVLNAATIVLWGDDIATTDGQIGLLDIPVVLMEIGTGAFGAVGVDLLAPLDILYSAGAGTVGELGLAAWPVGVAIVVVTVVVFDRAARRLARASLTAIPIIGPVLEVLTR